MQHQGIMIPLQSTSGKTEIGNKERKEYIMRTKLLLGLGIALLAMSCTSETEPQKEEATKITKIYVGAEKAPDVDTKTITDVNTNSVKWAEGDEIAVFHVNGTGRSDYKRFVLESGAGEASAYFNGVGADDYLTAGETYKVVYPYSTIGIYDGVNEAFNMHANISGSNNTDHLANHNWLVSTQQRISTDGKTPAFLLAQTTALAKIRVDIENFTLTGFTNRRYLSNVNFTTVDKIKDFYSYIFWNENLDVEAAEYSEVATAGFQSTNVVINNNTSYYYWMPIIQNTLTGIKKLGLSVHWRDANNVDYSSSIEYTPKSEFIPGFIYNIHLNLAFTEGSGNSAILSLVE